jgi:hypothetical protein
MEQEHDIRVIVNFNIEQDSFEVFSNAKRPGDIIEAYLRTKIGKGEDTTEANILDVYTIDIKLDLTEDTFYCTHNCGSKGLREGILVRYLEIQHLVVVSDNLPADIN